MFQVFTKYFLFRKSNKKSNLDVCKCGEGECGEKGDIGDLILKKAVLLTRFN